MVNASRENQTRYVHAGLSQGVNLINLARRIDDDRIRHGGLIKLVAGHGWMLQGDTRAWLPRTKIFMAVAVVYWFIAAFAIWLAPGRNSK